MLFTFPTLACSGGPNFAHRSKSTFSGANGGRARVVLQLTINRRRCYYELSKSSVATKGSGMRKHKNALRADPSLCYLCGLPIPADIVSPSHPLFGTVDHIVPRSRNGPDALHNRVPAHRICNAVKGNRMINPEEFAAELHLRIVPLLRSFGCEIKHRGRAAAIRRVVQAWHTWAPAYRKEAESLSLQRWVDDGGTAVEGEL